MAPSSVWDSFSSSVLSRYCGLYSRPLPSIDRASLSSFISYCEPSKAGLMSRFDLAWIRRVRTAPSNAAHVSENFQFGSTFVITSRFVSINPSTWIHSGRTSLVTPPTHHRQSLQVLHHFLIAGKDIIPMVLSQWEHLGISPRKGRIGRKSFLASPIPYLRSMGIFACLCIRSTSRH